MVSSKVPPRQAAGKKYNSYEHFHFRTGLIPVSFPFFFKNPQSLLKNVKYIKTTWCMFQSENDYGKGSDTLFLQCSRHPSGTNLYNSHTVVLMTTRG